MSNWLNAAETALAEIKKKTKVPFDWESFDSSGEKQLPDQYIVYFLVSETSALSVDGKEKSSTPRIQVSFYYRQKSKLPNMMDVIKKAFLKNGFSRAGSGRIPKQITTGHHGWRYDFIFYERKKI